MTTTSNAPPVPPARHYPAPSAVLELLKPITWFPPMWAFACGVVSSGVPIPANWPTVVLGVILAGPLVCAMSQAINDWYDRDVDAINEPHRPIPSGRIPGRWGLYIAAIWSVLSLIVAAILGRWVFVAAILGLFLAWAYSAPPLRLKQNGWWGNAACGFSYEGLAWVTGAAEMSLLYVPHFEFQIPAGNRLIHARIDVKIKCLLRVIAFQLACDGLVVYREGVF
jgi:chlorophyll synthase